MTGMDKMRKEEIIRVNIKPAEQTKNEFRWWSHVKRMAPTAPQSKTLVIQPVGRRPRGKPRNGWKDDIVLYRNCSPTSRYLGLQREWDPDDRSPQLGERQTSD